METDDLRTTSSGIVFEADLCIVGSGPAGLTLAAEFAAGAVRVLVVESGGLDPDDAAEQLGHIESVGAARVMEPGLVRNRVFGGTSHSWTGRCAPFDPIDFRARPWVPGSGWPFGRDEIVPFLGRAAPYLGLSSGDGRMGLEARDADADGVAGPGAELRHCLWQYSRDDANGRDFMRFGPAFRRRASGSVTRVLLHAAVTEVLTDPGSGRVSGVAVRSVSGSDATVRAPVVVLAAGGIENARLLLLSRSVAPCGLGNGHDTVGRTLMDHPRCEIAEFAPDAFARLRDRYGLFRLERGSNFFARGLTLSEDAQARHGLLNCAAWITEDRAADDPWDAAKRLVARRGSVRARAHDAWSVVSQPALLVRGLDDRVRRRRGLPHKLRRLVLDCIVEQRPDPESRVLLGDSLDPLGLPVARVDWRIGDAERETVAFLCDLIRRSFERDGLPIPSPSGWIRDRDPGAARFKDVAHPTGTTRMGEDPRTSVVDPNGQVHGVDGLYVAGSSVFPTSGHANPTLMIVALALRLADRLKAAEFGRAAPAAATVWSIREPRREAV